jgi:hypothetical protein
MCYQLCVLRQVIDNSSAKTYEVVDRAYYRTLDIPDQLWHSLRVYLVALGTELGGYHALAG